MRPEDIKEVEAITSFMAYGCGCPLSCSDKFLWHLYELIRNQCAELTHKMPDMVIMGQLTALTPVNTHTTKYMHQGEKV